MAPSSLQPSDGAPHATVQRLEQIPRRSRIRGNIDSRDRNGPGELARCRHCAGNRTPAAEETTFRKWLYQAIFPAVLLDVEEESQPGTLGKIYRAAAAKPRLPRAVHAKQPAKVLDKRRATWRSDARARRLEERIRLRM